MIARVNAARHRAGPSDARPDRPHGLSQRSGYLSAMESLGQLTAAEQEHFEERAAIVEYLTGWPRPMAEAEARRALGERRWWLTMNTAPGRAARADARTPGIARSALGKLSGRTRVDPRRRSSCS